MTEPGGRLVHLIQLDMPYNSSPVNVYLVEDEPLTLLDTGPCVESSLTSLNSALAGLGYAIGDIERVVVTHHHIDHFGLASIILDRSGAEICALDGAVPWIEDYPGYRANEAVFREGLMRLHGIPPELIAISIAQEAEHESWDPSVPVGRVLHEGDLLEFADRSWRILRRPGHSPYDTLFHDESRGVVFSGDHLISNISSNPLITPENGESPEQRPRTMATYRESLRQTRSMNVVSVLSGHGGPIHDHKQLIDRRFAGMARRREAVIRAVAGQRGTAHEIARSLWNDIALAQPYLTLTEVLGYLDMLGEEGLVREEYDGSTVTVVSQSG